VRADGSARIGSIDEVDRYGNLITDIPADSVPDAVVITVAGTRLRGPRPAYAAVEPGALVLVVGSRGTLEVAVRDGSAAEHLGLVAGAPCIVEPVAAVSEA